MGPILDGIGWDGKSLEGGCRAYRRWVVQELQRLPHHFQFVVIHGPTGSGKSRYLKNLQRSGEQVLDLEELAAHRGSVLGNLPDRPQPSQKWFESQLLAALSALDPARTVYVEGESRKIDRKSTRLNSSHSQISYAVFCLKKKKNTVIPAISHKYRYETSHRHTRAQHY